MPPDVLSNAKHGGEGVFRDVTLEKAYILELVVVGNKNQIDRDMQQINSSAHALTHYVI